MLRVDVGNKYIANLYGFLCNRKGLLWKGLSLGNKDSKADGDAYKSGYNMANSKEVSL